MISSISKYFAELLIKKNIVNIEDKEIYTYGLDYIIWVAVSVCIIFCISMITNLFFESLIYLTVLFIIRSNAGGYHSKTRIGCQFTFLLTYIFNIILFKSILFIPFKFIPQLLTLLSLLTIWAFAPVDHENKSFTKIEFRNFKRKARISAVIISCITIGGANFFSLGGTIYLAASLGLMTGTISLLIAKIKRRIKHYEKSKIYY